jgi:hypothetical protein
MPTVEQSVKSQFAKVFTHDDWCLFKKMADSNLREAAKLLGRDMPITSSLRLLARNSRKRLLIGIGVELLLKAVYLKHGYMINRPQNARRLKFPFLAQDAAGVDLITDQTFLLNDLIENLSKVIQLQHKDLTLKGLKIAKVFRNKEGHGVTTTHTFIASNYTDIAASLSSIYRIAFGEILSVRFSMAPSEKAVWRVSVASN